MMYDEYRVSLRGLGHIPYIIHRTSTSGALLHGGTLKFGGK